MTSVVIAAHNEAAVIGRCLDALLEAAEPGEFDVTVVANGSSDGTARMAAQRPGIRVLDLPAPGKAAALNAADAVAVGFPRVYLDADVVLNTQGLRALAAAVLPAASNPVPPLAAVPRRELDLSGRPMLVRAFYAINSRLPAYRDGLFGRGAIVLSAQGRRRFEEFPELAADDLFLDSLFTAAEKCQVDSVTSRVATPRRTRDLVRRLIRVRRGNTTMRSAAGSGVRPAAGSGVRPAAGSAVPPGGVRRAARLSWLRDVVLPRPWLAPAAACYVAITVVAALAARRTAAATGWERDDSSRQPVPAGTGRAAEDSHE